MTLWLTNRDKKRWKSRQATERVGGGDARVRMNLEHNV